MIFKNIKKKLGFIKNKIKILSLLSSRIQNKLGPYIDIGEKIMPDLSHQYSADFGKTLSRYKTIKIRNQQAFQVKFARECIDKLNGEQSVVDIGDSSGSQLLQLKEFCKIKETISINIDSSAIERIKEKGLRAYNCRAEELYTKHKIKGDVFLSFQTVEHLHDPCKFFREIAEIDFKIFVMTVPLRRQSTIGLKHLRSILKHKEKKLNISDRKMSNVNAESVHIFELSPKDWELLALHSGLELISQQTYLQYPAFIPGLKKIWLKDDFEGFWGASFIKNKSFQDLYKGLEQ